MHIIPGGLDDSQVIALLDHHVTVSRAQTARGSAHSLDHTALKAPDIAFWSMWEGDAVVAVAALRRFSADHGEVKSMHVAEAFRRRGAGGAMLRHVIAEARAFRLTRLSLETGSWDYFRPSHALYRGHGFVECAAFAGYAPDPNSLFFTLDLSR